MALSHTEKCYRVFIFKKYKLHLLCFGRPKLGKLKGKGRKMKKTMIGKLEHHIKSVLKYFVHLIFFYF